MYSNEAEAHEALQPGGAAAPSKSAAYNLARWLAKNERRRRRHRSGVHACAR